MCIIKATHTHTQNEWDKDEINAVLKVFLIFTLFVNDTKNIFFVHVTDFLAHLLGYVHPTSESNVLENPVSLHYQ